MRHLPKKHVSTNTSGTIPNPNSQLMLSAESNEDDYVTFGELVSMNHLPSLTSYELVSHGEDASWVGKAIASIVSGIVKPLQDWHTANLIKQAYSEHLAATKGIAINSLKMQHEEFMRQLEYDHELAMKRAEIYMMESERLHRYEMELAERGTLTAEAVYKLLYLKEKLASYARF